MELFFRVVIVTLCLWGALAILGLSLGFWPLVGLGALITVGLRAAVQSNS
ncbi:hypothetical protein ACWEF6_01780 [Amycolatopsis sp. NPDC004772]